MHLHLLSARVASEKAAATRPASMRRLLCRDFVARRHFRVARRQRIEAWPRVRVSTRVGVLRGRAADLRNHVGLTTLRLAAARCI